MTALAWGSRSASGRSPLVMRKLSLLVTPVAGTVCYVRVLRAVDD